MICSWIFYFFFNADEFPIRHIFLHCSIRWKQNKKQKKKTLNKGTGILLFWLFTRIFNNSYWRHRLSSHTATMHRCDRIRKAIKAHAHDSIETVQKLFFSSGENEEEKIPMGMRQLVTSFPPGRRRRDVEVAKQKKKKTNRGGGPVVDCRKGENLRSSCLWRQQKILPICT